jgi:GTP-binding protein Era
VKSGFIALAGRPNVGKSTLVNAMCGGKVAIVSDKPQTTRHRIYGIANGDGYQLVLVDLPGFQRPRDALTERMQRTVDRSLSDVDAVCVILAANEEIGAGDRFVAERAFGAGVPVVTVLNKVDRLKPGEIIEKIVEAAALGDFHALHPVSAKTGTGVEELRKGLVELLEDGPPHFPPETRSSLPIELQIAELIREKALQLTHDEVPHSVTVAVEELTDRRVTASLLVETQSQKLILVGKAGGMIKAIGTRARPDIDELLGRSIFLDLRVKVRDHWRRDEAMLDRLGL